MSLRVTIEDVARTAGVSRQTVSRVLNNKGEVSGTTRSRVQEAIAALGYHPSAIARSLSLQRTFSIGLVVPDITNPFFPEIARGVEDAARRENYNLFLCNTDEDPELELAALHSLDENRVEGVILVSSRLPEEQLHAWLEAHRNTVLVNRQPLDPATLAVFMDDKISEEIAASYLLELGHRRIGFLMGPVHSYSVQRRLEGYQKACRQRHIPCDEDLIIRESPTPEGGYRAARQLLNGKNPPTALLATNDVMAVGAMKYCIEMNIPIPEKISIFGHDDVPLAALISPALSTMSIPKYEVGQKATDLLLSRLRNDEPTQPQLLIEPKLVERESTAAPAVDIELANR
jgi:LacI family transcriptional regulator